MAVKLKQDSLYSKKVNISVMKEITKDINEIPLPNIPDLNHLLLPPPEFSLLKNNFQVYSEDIANKYVTNPQNNINNQQDNENNMNINNKLITEENNEVKKKVINNQLSKKVLGKKKLRPQAPQSNKIEIKLNQYDKVNFTEGLGNDEEENFD